MTYLSSYDDLGLEGGVFATGGFFCCSCRWFITAAVGSMELIAAAGDVPTAGGGMALVVADGGDVFPWLLALAILCNISNSLSPKLKIDFTASIRHFCWKVTNRTTSFINA